MAVSQKKKEYLRRRRRRKKIIRRCGLALTAMVLILAVVLIGKAIFGGKDKSAQKKSTEKAETSADVKTTAETKAETESEEDTETKLGKDDFVFHEEAIKDGQHYAVQTKNSVDVSEDTGLGSKYAILINTVSGNIVAYKNPYEQAVPASMTKVLTVLTASEAIPEEQLDWTTSIDQSVIDYCMSNDLSTAGLCSGEEVPVRDLFYCTILPSGADGAVGLAQYVSGTQDDFVVKMNEKLAEMDLASSAHFTNCIGLYNEEHFCTVYDMAMIMEAAMDNSWAKEVLSTSRYTTTPTASSPSGISLENLFLTRTEDADIPGTIVAAKTGYVSQSGNCAVSAMESNQGTLYICVTIGAEGPWNCIYDHEYLYSTYADQ